VRGSLHLSSIRVDSFESPSEKKKLYKAPDKFKHWFILQCEKKGEDS
jgi:hypothetical protein